MIWIDVVPTSFGERMVPWLAKTLKSQKHCTCLRLVSLWSGPSEPWLVPPGSWRWGFSGSGSFVPHCAILAFSQAQFGEVIFLLDSWCWILDAGSWCYAVDLVHQWPFLGSMLDWGSVKWCVLLGYIPNICSSAWGYRPVLMLSKSHFVYSPTDE